MEVSVRFWCIGTRLLYETRCMRRKAKDIEDKDMLFIIAHCNAISSSRHHLTKRAT